MKRILQLLTMAICLSSCYTPDPPPITKNPKASPPAFLLKRIETSGKVSFESWNGNLQGLDNDFVIHFYAKSKVMLERRSLAVDYFKGTSYITPNGRVEINLMDYHESWPTMILQLDGSDLLLYPEHRQSAVAPTNDPDVAKQLAGFWPFRASN